MIFVKNCRGGREVNKHCVKNKIVKNRVGRGFNLNLDNVCKYTVCFLTLPLNGFNGFIGFNAYDNGCKGFMAEIYFNFCLNK